jgi:sec-independent protein translocase protein TatA
MGLTNPTHLLVLVVIIAVVFGSSKLPGMARSAGKHAREAKDGVDSFKQELNLGEGNPISEVVDTVRSANPKTIVKNAAKNVVSPAETSKAEEAEAVGPAEVPPAAPAEEASPAEVTQAAPAEAAGPPARPKVAPAKGPARSQRPRPRPKNP